MLRNREGRREGKGVWEPLAKDKGHWRVGFSKGSQDETERNERIGEVEWTGGSVGGNER